MIDDKCADMLVNQLHESMNTLTKMKDGIRNFKKLIKSTPMSAKKREEFKLELDKKIEFLEEAYKNWCEYRDVICALTGVYVEPDFVITGSIVKIK